MDANTPTLPTADLDHNVAYRREPAPSVTAALGRDGDVAAAGGLRARRVCLVGAGNIAATHAEVLLRLPQLRVTAVVDPDTGAAERLARRFKGAEVYSSVAEALGAARFDAAHVLTPPHTHCATALPLLEAGTAVLVEKPLGVSRAECDVLIAAARSAGAALGINQNFVFHPALARLRRALDSGVCGPPRSVDCIYNMPLRQLGARQFGHWMFRAPRNLLLEQAVHPLSQIMALAGPIQDLQAMGGPPFEIAPGEAVFPEVSAILSCARLPAQLRFAVGQAFGCWQVRVVCDDGVLVADILANRFYAHRRTRWMEPVDLMLSGVRTGGAVAREAAANLADYAFATVARRGRSDPFFRSMEASLAAFHDASAEGREPMCDGAFGAAVVSACEAIGEAAFAPAAPPATPRHRSRAAEPCDIAVLGGTGFIGAHTVRRFVGQGLRVSVMARSPSAAMVGSADGEIVLHRGDIRDPAAVRTAIGDAPVVVNLAHGGGGATFEQVREAMVGGARTVAEAAMAAGVRRLVHVGSIASLYLGPQADAVTGAAPCDPRAEIRADYARCKALCEQLLMEMHEQDGLPVCIVRPGLVVGEGGSPFHSGLGLFNNDQHCIGWNGGRNPLPFVLAEDVAEAIALAAAAPGVEGRSYNLVGDIRPTARAFVSALAQATGRPLRFHPSMPTLLWTAEFAKWLIKRAGGRAAPAPEMRELLSRGLSATFNCSDAKRDLGWAPVDDAATFFRLAVGADAP